jgi:hypothetical protein
MKAKNLLKQRIPRKHQSFVDLVVWEVSEPLAGNIHNYKYRLAYVVNNICLLRYDNEAGKGDHKHISNEEVACIFTTPAQLIADFWADVDLLEKTR